MIPRRRGRRASNEGDGGKVGGMRSGRTWRVLLVLLLIVPLGGACKKKGPHPGEGGAGAAGLGEEGLGGSSLERAKRGLGPEEGGVLGDVRFSYDSAELDSASRDVLVKNVS